MSNVEIPNLGALLVPYLAQVPAEARPRFLALLERGAADRYRYWAEVLPQHADVFLLCAAGEDEIADRIESVFTLTAEPRDSISSLLPGARDTYHQVFESLDVWDQLRVQANAERLGAQVWRNSAADASDVNVLVQLARCAALEEESADRLDQLVAGYGG